MILLNLEAHTSILRFRVVAKLYVNSMLFRVMFQGVSLFLIQSTLFRSLSLIKSAFPE